MELLGKIEIGCENNISGMRRYLRSAQVKRYESWESFQTKRRVTTDKNKKKVES